MLLAQETIRKATQVIIERYIFAFHLSLPLNGFSKCISLPCISHFTPFLFCSCISNHGHNGWSRQGWTFPSASKCSQGDPPSPPNPLVITKYSPPPPPLPHYHHKLLHHLLHFQRPLVLNHNDHSYIYWSCGWSMYSDRSYFALH